MLKLEARPEQSKLMSVMSPVLMCSAISEVSISS